MMIVEKHGIDHDVTSKGWISPFYKWTPPLLLFTLPFIWKKKKISIPFHYFNFMDTLKVSVEKFLFNLKK